MGISSEPFLQELATLCLKYGVKYWDVGHYELHNWDTGAHSKEVVIHFSVNLKEVPNDSQV